MTVSGEHSSRSSTDPLMSQSSVWPGSVCAPATWDCCDAAQDEVAEDCAPEANMLDVMTDSSSARMPSVLVSVIASSPPRVGVIRSGTLIWTTVHVVTNLFVGILRNERIRYYVEVRLLITPPRVAKNRSRV